MADEKDDEKTEEASQSRREDFRNRGQVVQTKELATALFLLIAAGSIYLLSQFFFKNIYELFNYAFGAEMTRLVHSGNIQEALRFGSLKVLLLCAPVLAIAFITSMASSIVQVGFLQVEDAFDFDLNKISPLEGFKKLFSLRALVEGLKSILKLLAVIMVVYFLLRGEYKEIPYLMTYSVEEIVSYTGKIVVKLFSGVGFTILVIAAADYFYQRWDLEKKMMMSKQEVKEEHKQKEGDPQIKNRIRRLQREMANKRMMESIPKADVVVTNPTHIAVVLKYDSNLPAPQLVAKGADLIAEKIKSIAREHRIPIVENRPLARTIFKTMKIGQVIPRELFVAMAEVLSYVYKLRKKVKK
ncbi:MAG: flagellar biosynthesis protein FlhB [Pseudobdellovibrionaceae bacterium]